MKLAANNWTRFQHYRDRQPPWIKLHREVINSFAWSRLQLASKALAPCLWMLASENVDGIIDADPSELAWKFGMTESEVLEGIDGLVKANFFAIDAAPYIYNTDNIITEDRDRERDRVREQSALAARLQDASRPLARQPRAKRASVSDPAFEAFWKTYPRKVAKAEARKAWGRAMGVTTPEAIETALRAAKWPEDPKYIPHPATWLNQGRWEDEAAMAPVLTPEQCQPATDESHPLYAVMKDKITPGMFRAWIQPLRVVQDEDGRRILLAPSRFFAAYLQNHYAQEIRAAFRDLDWGQPSIAVVPQYTPDTKNPGGAS